MEYFGYLRRNPNDAPEATLDFQGYNFWLSKLNQFKGDFMNAEMVKAFITSSEYIDRIREVKKVCETGRGLIGQERAGSQVEARPRVYVRVVTG